MIPKRLHAVKDVTVSFEYKPENVFLNLTQELQDITVYFDPPAFIMSPRIRLYRVDQIVKYSGYLNVTLPEQTEATEPEAIVTIVASNQ